MIKYNFYIGLLVWGALSLSSCAHEDIINDISENNPQNKENNPDKSNDNDLPDLYTLKQNDSFIKVNCIVIHINLTELSPQSLSCRSI